MKKMSTLAYIKKYKLTENDKFSHSDFAKDFISEFSMRVINNDAVRDYYRFEKTINEAKAKYNAINNKTLGDIGQGLWDFMFGKFISTFRDTLFPEYKNNVTIGIMPDADFLHYVNVTIDTTYVTT